MANDVMKLESVEIWYCDGMKEIVSRGDAPNRSNIVFEFSKLTTLELFHVPELRCFYEGPHAIEFQALTLLGLGHCDKLEAFGTETMHSEVKPILSSLEKVMSNLEVLSIFGMKETKWLQDIIGNNVYLMHNIKQLIFGELSSIEILFWFLHGLPNLESLQLYNSVIKEVLPNGSYVSLEKIGTVVQIKNVYLNVSDIPLNILFENGAILQTVEKLCIKGCYYSTNLIPSNIALTQYLSYLKVSNCSELRSLLTSATAKSLVQLTTMKVAECAKMEEIVTVEENEEEKEDEIVFGKLKSLALVSLGNLTSFCNSQSKLVFKFPSLEKVKVRDCLGLEKFSENIVITPNLEKVYIVEGEEEDKWYWEGDLNATIQKMFTDKVPFEFCQNLKLSSHPVLQQLWRGEISPPDNCFNNLRTLIVEDCSFLSKVFPSRLLPYFKNLEELQVSSSPVEVIFDMDSDSFIETNGKPFNLKRMTLRMLHNLKCVWSKDPCSTMSFRNLKEMVVTRCAGIKTLFPASLARNLVRLKKLEIGRCDALEEIVGKEEAVSDGASRKIEFPYLTTLSLYHLPSLVSFYSGNTILEFSALTVATIEECPRMKCFSHGVVRAPNFVGINTSRDEDDLPEHNDLNTIVQQCFHEKLANFARDAFHLNLSDHPELQGIWEGLTPVPDRAFNNLNYLTVDGCQFLSHCVIPSHLVLFLCNLEWLQVRNCYSVKVIFDVDPMSSTPFSFPLKRVILQSLPNLEQVWNEDPQEIISFQSLEDVTVNECRSLKSLFPASIAKGKLENLKRLQVECCEGLVEIVASQETTSEEATRNLVIFPNLTELKLWKLPELRCIYLGPNTVEWPKLKELDVYQCGQLKNIGVEGLDHFSIIMEATITLEKVFPNLEHLSLGKEDVQIWQAPFHAKLLHTAKFLKLQGFCDDSDVFPYGFFEKESLPHVEKLAVSHSNFKQMFISDRSNLDGYADKFFSQLKTLELISLLKLSSIGLEHTPLPGNLEALKVTSCPCLINLALSTVSFSNLRALDVIDCDGLVYLFTSSTAKSLALLENLTVYRCGSMREIVAKEDEIDQDEITFGNLKDLVLGYLPILDSFSIGTYHLKFPCLQRVSIFNCSQMKVFSHADIYAPDNVTIDPSYELKDMIEKAFKKAD